jgi:hypothetical protein
MTSEYKRNHNVEWCGGGVGDVHENSNFEVEINYQFYNLPNK